MKDEMVGSLLFLSLNRWNNFKEKYPLKTEQLNEAVVKDIDEKTVLIEKERIVNILNDNSSRLLI